MLLMSWIAPISALIGGIIGVAATLLGEQFRWQREKSKLDYSSRHQIYSAFLAALLETYQQTFLLARKKGISSETRTTTAHEAFLNSNVYQMRFQLSLVAPWKIVELAEDSFGQLHELNHMVASGIVFETENFKTQAHRCRVAFETARMAMRKDLGSMAG
jgi:hypothetical protein